jgi:hypothetical protein
VKKPSLTKLLTNPSITFTSPPDQSGRVIRCDEHFDAEHLHLLSVFRLYVFHEVKFGRIIFLYEEVTVILLTKYG